MQKKGQTVTMVTQDAGNDYTMNKQALRLTLPCRVNPLSGQPHLMYQRQSEWSSIVKSQAQRKGLKRAIFTILDHSD